MPACAYVKAIKRTGRPVGGRRKRLRPIALTTPSLPGLVLGWCPELPPCYAVATRTHFLSEKSDNTSDEEANLLGFIHRQYDGGLCINARTQRRN